MNYSSTDYLKLLTNEHAHILLERSLPRGHLKRDFVSIKLPSGKDASRYARRAASLFARSKCRTKS